MASAGTLVFVGIAVLALGLEVVALLRPEHHARLRQVFRWLRSHRVMRWALLVSWGFVGWHFFAQ